MISCSYRVYPLIVSVAKTCHCLYSVMNRDPICTRVYSYTLWIATLMISKINPVIQGVLKTIAAFKDDELRLIHDSVKGSKHHCWFYVAITVMSVSLKSNWNETVGCIPISTLVCYVVYQILHTLGRVTISTNVCVHIHFIL